MAGIEELDLERPVVGIEVKGAFEVEGGGGGVDGTAGAGLRPATRRRGQGPREGTGTGNGDDESVEKALAALQEAARREVERLRIADGHSLFDVF